MLRIVESFNNLPICFPVDFNASFQPGQLCSISIKNGKEVAGICDGLNPIGIIDDIKSKTKRNVVWNEVCIIDKPVYWSEGKAVLEEDAFLKLRHHNIVASSFHSNIPCILDFASGAITLTAGTKCNLNRESGSLSVICNYAYNENGIIDDSTVGTGMITVWTHNMIIDTDMFDTSAMYPKYANLYVEHGLFTTKRISPMCKCVGMVLASPTVDYSFLRVMFDIPGNIVSSAKSQLSA